MLYFISRVCVQQESIEQGGVLVDMSIIYTFNDRDAKLLKLREQLALFDDSAISSKRIADERDDWDYADADTKTETHCFHVYPAMMIPQVARRLMQLFGRKGDVVLDPFCGSGTVLVEAKMAGFNSWGIDINPLALLIARVKTTPIDVRVLRKQAIKLLDAYQREREKLSNTPNSIEVPRFFNIDYWFSPTVSCHLAALRKHIFALKDKAIREFFLVAFSETVREVSYTRNDEFKLFRIPPEQLPHHNPDVGVVFFSKVYRNMEGMAEFISKADLNTEVRILSEDTRYRTSLPASIIDLVITSPPYGDSRTTVAYGQFSRLSLQWLGLPWEEVRRLDARSLGGQRREEFPSQWLVPSLRTALAKIESRDRKRAMDVKAFYYDFALCLCEINRVCKLGATACFVIGNRTVKGVRIPTDKILIELGEVLGFIHVETFHRSIPNKRMPLRNSPSNVAGEVSETITQEHIIILRKVRQIDDRF